MGGAQGAAGAVQRALAGVGNNATAPATVRQGRRAGQPSAAGGPDASFAFDLPNSQYGRGPEAWGAGGGGSGQEGGGKPPLAAPPLLPAPLNERLAKLKLKLGRRTEEGGVMGLPVGGVPGAPPPQPHPPASSRPSAISSRPISATSAASADEAAAAHAPHPRLPPRGGGSAASSGTAQAGEDSLDREIKRQSSLGGAVFRQPSPPPPRMSSAGT